MTKEEIREKAIKYCETQYRHYNTSIAGAFIDGAEWMQKKMIEKAVEWLSNNMFHSINYGVQINGTCISDFIERFKKAMQDESK